MTIRGSGPEVRLALPGNGNRWANFQRELGPAEPKVPLLLMYYDVDAAVSPHDVKERAT